MEREYKFLPLFFSLTAGLVASIIFIVHRSASITSLTIVLSALLVFYVAGLIFRSILTALKTPEVKADEKEEEEPADGDTSELDENGMGDEVSFSEDIKNDQG